MDEALAFCTITEIVRHIRSGELSPVELTRVFLERIDRYNGHLNAYITVTAERALAAARAAEAAIAGGQYLGPLHGIPMALKDLVDTAGIRTTAGSILFRDRVPERDAAVARRLFEAGAVLLGKTHMVEFAFGGPGINHHYGTPWNPWDPAVHRLPGGSSSGSGVAVAGRLATFAIGSDTGGSVRIPASFCGVVGLKPTFGRVSRAGIVPLDPTLDSMGPLTLSVRDAAIVHQLLAGPEPADPDTWAQPLDDASGPLEDGAHGARIGIPREFFWADVDPEVAVAVRAAAQVLAGLGAEVDEVSIPELAELTALAERGNPAAVEAYLYFRNYLDSDFEAFDPIVSKRMIQGATLPAVEYLGLKRAYRKLASRAAEVLDRLDALLTPTTPMAAPPVADVDRQDQYFEVHALCVRNTAPVNRLGLCAISVPCGFTRAALPVGMQLIGGPFREARILRLAYAYEQATEWGKRVPPCVELPPPRLQRSPL
ncbi:MAG: amidase [Gemmatimonadetes bacterium]|nr:amidase [Gemmatimonadota bacterium]